MKITKYNLHTVTNAAPNMLGALIYSYVSILACNDFSWRIANQKTLIEMRDAIAEATDIDSQTIQTMCEEAMCETLNGVSIEDVIKKQFSDILFN